MKNRVFIFDTTLRDGEQGLPSSLSMNQKIRIARQLGRLKVDIIEAGFPISSPGDFESVQTIAKKIRATESDFKEATKMDALIKPYFDGNQYWVAIAETYRDIRLVGFPPNGIGAFGGDVDILFIYTPFLLFAILIFLDKTKPAYSGLFYFKTGFIQ